MKRSTFKPRAPQRRPERQMDYTPKPRPVTSGPGLLRLLNDLPAITSETPAATTAAGQRHMGRVAALGCVLCRLRGFGPTPAEVHHIRIGQGGAQRAPDFLTVPLCPYGCHRGPKGIHGDRSLLRAANVTELDLLAETLALIFKGVT